MAGLFRFHEVYEREIEAINERRAQLKRKKVRLRLVENDRNGHPVRRPDDDSNLVGLALSGGGVRSAAVCLGVMQALDDVKMMERVDYLSTVSGGGYIGTSAVAAMSESKEHRFPFPSELKADETPGLRHVRDHSNYLFPRGKRDLFNNLAIYLRGLVSNAILILPFLLIAALITIYSNPDSSHLTRADLFGHRVPVLFATQHFGIALHLMLLISLLLAIWAIFRCISNKYRDVGTFWTFISTIALLGLLLAAFCEIQPLALSGMFKLAKGETDINALIVAKFKYLSATLAAFSAAVGFLAPLFGQLLKKGTENPTWTARIGRVAARAAILLASAAVPLVLWVIYLYLSYWGIRCHDCDPAGLFFAPQWIQDGATYVFGPAAEPWHLYAFAAAIMLLAGFLFTFRPNANSLHRLYRDRLSKAFLFNPDRRESGILARFGARMPGMADGEIGKRALDLTPLDELKQSKVKTRFAPFQIINAALNIQGSKYANQRGRNADFFVFTPQFTGSEATFYVQTRDMEQRVGDLDLGAAMAISGAAASSNMGSSTIKTLSPTLAILNVRLGFWLPNPLWVARKHVVPRILRLLHQLYFLREIAGWLNERSSLIYLTDGGHIENLGIYELLRRRCQLIIAVDAEADPQMSFNSFVALQRYALIDLGVLVRLPWSKIRDASRRAAEDIVKTGGRAPGDAPKGPHCAIGEIEYPGGGKGVLLYVKSSLTGDENDYIVDYKRRYPDFPHETTADQLFSEEQFEVYRALGFHAMRRVLQGRDDVAIAGGLTKLTRRSRSRLVRDAAAMLA